MYRFIKSISNIIIFLLTIQIVGGCQEDLKKKDDPEYASGILEDRKINFQEITDSATSRFNEEERMMFSKKPPKYFAPDIDYKITANFEVDTSYPVFQMPTTTDRKPNYRIYGYLNFKVKDTLCRLTVYQNYDYKDHPEYGNSLFIPFKDNTSEFSTYGGGRYIDIPKPDAELVTLDFNTAYNPLCAYSERWSCPLVPMNNAIEVAIFAGEKKYK
jgi:uncharacterized protein (DUF1684 family)